MWVLILFVSGLMEVDTAESGVLGFHFWFMAFVLRFLDKAYHKTAEWNKLQRVA